MKQSQREIAQALDWFAGLLAENMRMRARDIIHQIGRDGVDDVKADTFNEIADMIEETRRDMKRMIPDA